jgi:hypothetical protein
VFGLSSSLVSTVLCILVIRDSDISLRTRYSGWSFAWSFPDPPAKFHVSFIYILPSLLLTNHPAIQHCIMWLVRSIIVWLIKAWRKKFWLGVHNRPILCSCRQLFSLLSSPISPLTLYSLIFTCIFQFRQYILQCIWYSQGRAS